QSIEGNITSQFGQHLRAIFNLPLGDTASKTNAVMINLLGEPDFQGLARYVGLDKVLGISGVHVHLYGTKYTEPFRKKGHVTITNHHRAEGIGDAAAGQKTLKGRPD